MNATAPKYASFALVREMLETPSIIGHFDFARTKTITQALTNAKQIIITGEGSSRIFPAKNVIHLARQYGCGLNIFTEGSRQCLDYALANHAADNAVIASSNSGQTAETIDLLVKLQAAGHQQRYVVTANPAGKILEFANESLILSCGKEEAVAASKSVVEQALVYHSLLCNMFAACDGTPQCSCASDARQAAHFGKEILAVEYPATMVEALAEAGTVYWAGRNNGVAEELTLKTCEITRQKSDFLEGTYLLHGVEEIMQQNDIIILVDPNEADWKRIQERYVDAINIKIIAISAVQTPFETIIIPKLQAFEPTFLARWGLSRLIPRRIPA